MKLEEVPKIGFLWKPVNLFLVVYICRSKIELKRRMLFDENLRFVVDGLFYYALLLVFYFNQH